MTVGIQGVHIWLVLTRPVSGLPTPRTKSACVSSSADGVSSSRSLIAQSSSACLWLIRFGTSGSCACIFFRIGVSFVQFLLAFERKKIRTHLASELARL